MDIIGSGPTPSERSHRTDTIFWKIDYYDQDLCSGSEDPRDLSKTCRVLTILLAEEW